MTETNEPADQSWNLAAIFKGPDGIRGMAKKLEAIEDSALTPEQAVLLEDCQGLLHAVAGGHPIDDRSMIRERLVEAGSLFGDGKATVNELPKAQREALREIRFTLRMVAAYGVAADPQIDPSRPPEVKGRA